MGIRFQLEPLGEMHDIILHVRMLDRENRLQQEAIGMLGVNLLYGAFHQYGNPDDFIQSLADGIDVERIEIDMIEFNGPAFEKFDNRILCLKLTQAGLTDAIMFDQKGFVVQASEVLYKKSCLIERGSFRPVTKVNLDMLENAKKQFITREQVDEGELMVFTELTLGSLANEGTINYKDFISRIEVINACGYGVLVSNYFEYYKLASYLRRLIKKPIGLVMGLNNLADIFKQEYYSNLEGGILEAFGVLFKDNIRIYAYPVEKETFERYRQQFRRGDNVSINETKSGLINVENLFVADNLRNLYKYIRENGFLETISECNRENMKFFSRDIFDRIVKREEGWKNNLPESVAKMIEAKNLWREA